MTYFLLGSEGRSEYVTLPDIHVPEIHSMTEKSDTHSKDKLDMFKFLS